MQGMGTNGTIQETQHRHKRGTLKYSAAFYKKFCATLVTKNDSTWTATNPFMNTFEFNGVKGSWLGRELNGDYATCGSCHLANAA